MESCERKQSWAFPWKIPSATWIQSRPLPPPVTTKNFTTMPPQRQHSPSKRQRQCGQRNNGDCDDNDRGNDNDCDNDSIVTKTTIVATTTIVTTPTIVATTTIVITPTIVSTPTIVTDDDDDDENDCTTVTTTKNNNQQHQKQQPSADTLDGTPTRSQSQRAPTTTS